MLVYFLFSFSFLLVALGHGVPNLGTVCILVAFDVLGSCVYVLPPIIRWLRKAARSETITFAGDISSSFPFLN